MNSLSEDLYARLVALLAKVVSYSVRLGHASKIVFTSQYLLSSTKGRQLLVDVTLILSSEEAAAVSMEAVTQGKSYIVHELAAELLIKGCVKESVAITVALLRYQGGDTRQTASVMAPGTVCAVDRGAVRNVAAVMENLYKYERQELLLASLVVALVAVEQRVDVASQAGFEALVLPEGPAALVSTSAIALENDYITEMIVTTDALAQLVRNDASRRQIFVRVMAMTNIQSVEKGNTAEMVRVTRAMLDRGQKNLINDVAVCLNNMGRQDILVAFSLDAPNAINMELGKNLIKDKKLGTAAAVGADMFRNHKASLWARGKEKLKQLFKDE